jgi:IMP dehydrogenase
MNNQSFIKSSLLLFFVMILNMVNAQSPLTVDKVSIFTDGNSYFQKSGTIVTKNKFYSLGGQDLPIARYGTLMITDKENSLLNITSCIRPIQTDTMAYNVSNANGLLSLNLGMNVEIMTDQKTINGKLLQVFPNYVVLKTNKTIMIKTSDIQSFTFDSEPKYQISAKQKNVEVPLGQRGKDYSKYTSMKLEFSSDGEKSINLKYLQKGLSWSPVYTLSLLNKKKAKLVLQAEINVPFVSSIMQSVSDDGMAIALAKEGGLSFVFGSQTIESQANMVRKVKKYKAGFVESRANLTPEHTLQDVINMKKKTGFSNIGITDDGTSTGKFLGLVTGRDYRIGKDELDRKVKEFMTPLDKLHIGRDGITLTEANDIIWDHKLNTLPVLDENDCLKYFVFRKDYENHKDNPHELLDSQKRLVVGAGINSRDHEERVPALIEAGVDVLCIDSSDGYSEWQKSTIEYIKEKYGNDIPVGAGNVVDRDGFLYLAEAGADFIKVGVGGGSICITREQKGIGRGQATALIEVAAARDEYFEKTGEYIPICSDGGIVQDYHMTLALAMGADFLMMGRYFARFDESPTRKLLIGGNYVKEYWGEGSNRARNWQRYDMGGSNGLKFEEGVDSYVPYAGKLKDNLDVTLGKIKSTMCSAGVMDLCELRNDATLTLVSSTSIIEGGAHDVIVKDSKN